MFRVHQHQDPPAFRDRVLPTLLRAEAENCRIISLAMKLCTASTAGSQPARLWTVESDTGVELVAVQKPGDLMEVSRGSTEAVDALVEALIADGGMRAIVGPEPTIAEIISRYACRARVVPKLHRRFKGHVLSEVTSPRRARGVIRCCAEPDRQTLGEFIDAYMASINEPAHADTGSVANELTAAKRVFFWCDPHPVGMAAWAGPTPNGIRINYVFTQPDCRNRGYASSLVAALSQRLLDGRRRSCFLFTDGENIHAEQVYKRIGYHPVSEGAHWVFEHPVK